MTQLKQWFDQATPEDRKRLAQLATGGSTQYLYQLATGRRRATAEKAAEVEQGTLTVSRETGGRLQPIPRTELCAACSECPFALACRAASEEQR